MLQRAPYRRGLPTILWIKWLLFIFGNRLRKDLIALMPVDSRSTTPFKSRPASAGSQTLSINSNEDHASKQDFTSGIHYRTPENA